MVIAIEHGSSPEDIQLTKCEGDAYYALQVYPPSILETRFQIEIQNDEFPEKKL